MSDGDDLDAFIREERYSAARRAADALDDELRERADIQEMLSAWRSGKFMVKAALVIGSVIAALGGAVMVVKNLIGVGGPHP